MVGIGDDDEKLCRFDTQQGDRCHILRSGRRFGGPESAGARFGEKSNSEESR